jgi:DNA-directed RNA polymerase specialized sigma24 family protein
VQEASAVLALREGTARSRLSRARARLRTALADRGLGAQELMAEEV